MVDRFVYLCNPVSIVSHASFETNYRKILILNSCNSYIKPRADMLLKKKKKKNWEGNETKKNILITLT